MSETLQQATRRLAAAAVGEGYQFQALHEYRDVAGAVIFYRVRLKHPDGRKWIRPMHLNHDNYVLSEPPAPPLGRTLYRLPELVSVSASEVIYVTEGEPKADLLAQLGLTATTSGGATSAGGADWSRLARRRARIWPDNDAAGAKYAETVTSKLMALDCVVEVLDVTGLGLPLGGDVVDWQRQHPTAAARDIVGLPWRSEAAAPKDDRLVIQRLAAMAPMEYERVREAEAAALGVRVTLLDAQVRKAPQPEEPGVAGTAVVFPEVIPWPDPVDGAELLSDIVTVLQRYLILTVEQARAIVLWIVFTWIIDAVDIAPNLNATSPEKRCGKTQLMILVSRLVRRPLVASNITGPAVFRCLEAWTPTLLLDEVDTYATKDNEQLRGIINSGHSRDSAFVVRTVGDEFEPRRFSTWGARMLSGIGKLPDTVRDRSIVIEMRRKKPGEKVERLRHAQTERFNDFRGRLARWSTDHLQAIRQARPVPVEEVNDRAQDNWEPLLAIADVAGGAWPKDARDACLKLSGAEQEAPTLGVELVRDCVLVFQRRQANEIRSKDLISELLSDTEKPWQTANRSKEITPRWLSERLEPFGIRPGTHRIAGKPAKGYLRGQFDDAYARYGDSAPVQPVESVTRLQPQLDGTLS